MRSPFSGMNPYLEQPAFWQDFHHNTISQMSYALAAQLPEGYATAIEPRIEILVRGTSGPDVFYPGVGVSQMISEPARSGTAAAPAALEMTYAPLERLRVASLEVRHLPDERLVAVIELLSPINKHFEALARDAYLHERDTFPSVPVPLAAGDADAVLDVQSAFEATFALAQYHRRMRYDEMPPGPLT